MLSTTLPPLTLAAINSLDTHVGQLKERYPQHRFSFGYIGNLERWGDDRSWYIFSRYLNADTRTSVSYSLGDTDRLNFGPDRLKQIEAWVARLEANLAAGKIVTSR